MTELKFEKLTRSHNRAIFDSGVEELNEFLRKFARQNAKKNLGETYVLTNANKDILGYYTISTASLEYHLHPENEGLPKYAIPSALIGRLGVDKNYRGHGYGKLLLTDALLRIVKIADEIGVHCITVDAKDDSAHFFYKKFGFEELTDHKNHLFISVDKVKTSIPTRRE